MTTIKFHPFNDETVDFAEAPKPASRFVPKWYKNQVSNYSDKDDFAQGAVTSTIKRCMPIFDMMTAGYIITAPCDIYVDATDPEKLVYSIPIALREYHNDLFSKHDILQYKEYPIDKSYFHKDLLRLFPFWIAETKPGYSCMFINPAHQDESPLTAFSGIIDTDRFMSDGHFSFTVKKDFKGIIKQGTPLVQIIPFKREDWTSEVVEASVSKAERKRQTLVIRSVFSNGYKNKLRFRKEYK